MASLNIIIGAGFSIPAGFPSGNELNEKFFIGLENNILRVSSGEWYFDEHGKTFSHNGRLNTQYLSTSYLLSEFVEKFQKENHSIFNYEEFYDWFNQVNGNVNLIEELSEIVNARIKISHPRMKDDSYYLIQNPDINLYYIIKRSFNFLIKDLLEREYNKNSTLDTYEPFINYISKWDNVNIFTLNHDLLLEHILDNYNIEYSDGFSKENTQIFGSNEEAISTFQNKYESRIKLFKLHGSIDFLEMFCQKRNSNIFFKPNTYRDRHFIKTYNGNNGELEEIVNANIVPQFLTGKDKINSINNHFYYEKLYNYFNESFSSCDEVAVIGYSYGDKHINSIIKNSTDNYNFRVLNINPSIKFPFRKNYSRDLITDLNYISNMRLLQHKDKTN